VENTEQESLAKFHSIIATGKLTFQNYDQNRWTIGDAGCQFIALAAYETPWPNTWKKTTSKNKRLKLFAEQIDREDDYADIVKWQEAAQAWPVSRRSYEHAGKKLCYSIYLRLKDTPDTLHEFLAWMRSAHPSESATLARLEEYQNEGLQTEDPTIIDVEEPIGIDIDTGTDTDTIDISTGTTSGTDDSETKSPTTESPTTESSTIESSTTVTLTLPLNDDEQLKSLLLSYFPIDRLRAMFCE
jgi:hypothetical protein